MSRENFQGGQFFFLGSSLSIGWDQGRCRHLRSSLGRGFTLVELVVVTALIGILLGVLVPLLGYDRYEASRAGRELEAQIRFLRGEASSAGLRHRLRLKLTPAISIPEVESDQGFLAMDDILGRPRRLSVERIGRIVTPRGKTSAFFVEPGGFVEPALIEVEVRGKIWTLSVHALTGKIEVRSGRIESRGG